MRKLLLSKGLALARSRSKAWMSSGCSAVAFSMSIRRVCITKEPLAKLLRLVCSAVSATLCLAATRDRKGSVAPGHCGVEAPQGTNDCSNSWWY